MATISQALAIALEHHQAGRRAQAEQIYQQILAVEPDQPDAMHLLGVLAHQAGQHELAIERLRRAIRLNGNVAAFHNNLGEAYRAAGKLSEAVASYQRALKLDRNYADAHNNLGNALRSQGKLDEAVTSFRRALNLKPRFAEARNNLANAVKDQGRLQEAISFYRQAIEARPSYAKAHFNLGAALQETGDVDGAIACYRRAIELQPDFAEAYNNLGNSLADQGGLEQSMDCYHRAIELKPDFAEAHVGASTLLLLRGDWQRGWPEYEYRLRVEPNSAERFAEKCWQGEPLAGRTILLRGEQGLGDTLQFARFAALLTRQGARVILECQRALLPILESCPGIDQLCAIGETLPPFDVQAPLLSLPRILKTSASEIPATIPYLRASKALVEQWRHRLAEWDGFKVGISWQGSRQYRRDRYRSIPLKLFAPLARMPGVRLVSLQKGAGSEQIANVEFPVIDLSAELDEASGPFMDTAALLMNLDLVVTSDTAVAHLAGALGRPVWVLLGAVPDWRWGLEGTDSSWYPSMRLFRQTTLDDWTVPIDRVASAIQEELATRAPK